MTRGFTLIECLVYIALLTLLTIGSHAAVIAVAASADRISEEALLLREAMFLRGRISEEVRESDRVLESGDGLLVLEQDGGIQARFEWEEDSLIYTRQDTTLSLAPAVKVLGFTADHASSTDPAQLMLTFELGGGAIIRRFSYLLYP